MNEENQSGHGQSTRRGFLQSSGGLTAALLSEELPGQGTSPGGADSTAPVIERLGQLKPGHPRLHFTAAAADRFRDNPGKGRARYARLLLEWADRNREWSPLATLASIPDRSFTGVVLEEQGALVTNLALAFVVGGRKDHLELARSRAGHVSLARSQCRGPGRGRFLQPVR